MAEDFYGVSLFLQVNFGATFPNFAVYIESVDEWTTCKLNVRTTSVWHLLVISPKLFRSFHEIHPYN
jgi:hypothetical protein